jgi:hypothetical protein
MTIGGGGIHFVPAPIFDQSKTFERALVKPCLSLYFDESTVEQRLDVESDSHGIETDVRNDESALLTESKINLSCIN